MKMKVLLMTIVMLSFVTKTFALLPGQFTAPIQGYYWTFDITSSSSRTVEVSNIPDKEDMAYVDIPQTVVNPDTGIEYTVTGIGSYASNQSYWIRSVTIPTTVEYIGERAFDNCSKLWSVDGAEGVKTIGAYAFSNSKSLLSFSWNDVLETIGEGAFSNTNLFEVELPSNIVSISSFAFTNVSGCKVIVHRSNPPTLASDAFNKTSIYVYVPYGCINAYKAAEGWKNFTRYYEFDNSDKILFADENVKALCVANWDTSGDGELSLVEAAAVTSLGTLFKENTTIQTFHELKYFTGLTSIESNAFYHCSGLTQILIPNSVTSIGEQAFLNCSGLTSIIIPNGVTSIGARAFYGCLGLTSIIIPNGVTSIGGAAFYNCSGLTSVNIPNSVTSIGTQSFAHCSDLISIVVESGNTVYDSRNNCNAIIKTAANELVVGCKNTIIPNSVTSIGAFAFDYCSSLTSIIIPNSVTSIGAAAFRGCDGLTSVTVEWETPITIPSNVFSNYTNATLYVPAGCQGTYEAAEVWTNFGEIIEMTPSVTVGDLNGDGSVSITDVVLIIDVIAGTITDANQVAAADVNGDGTVSITDCVAAIELIAAQQHNSPLMAMAPGMMTISDYISGELQDGKLTVELNNENRYTAFQMLVSVPEGMTLVKASMDEVRGAEHQMFVRNIGDGQYLVAGFSLDNEELTGNSGRLLTIETEGQTTGNIVISDVEFATADAKAWHLKGITVSGSTTGIADMNVNSEQTVYDLQGRKLDSQILRSERTQGMKRIVIVNGKKVVTK